MAKETKAQRHLRLVSEIATKALRDAVALSLVYDGFERVVEVHAIGVSTGGLPCMRVFQVRGANSNGWRMLLLHKVEPGAAPLPYISEAPRPGYNRGDKGMLSISEEL